MLHIACPGSVKTMIAVIITSARCESMLDPTANPAYSVLMDWATLPTTAAAARPQVSRGECKRRRFRLDVPEALTPSDEVKKRFSRCRT